MPTVNVLRKSPIYKSFRVEQLKGMFDLPHKDEVSQSWSVTLPITEREWQVGLIVGASGSGKTSVASEIFKDSYIHTRFDWPQNAAMIDGFDNSIKTKEIVELLSSVGLSSPPHWLKPFHHLSNGQQFRAELARLMLCEHKLVVFDEFTSVVDRDVAKICCSALSKVLRKRQRPQLVALSCHFDIIDWLQPDWVLEVGSNAFEWRSLQRRPNIQLEIYETDVRTWQIFKGHHYLSADINKASRCFVATWNGKPVAFTAVLHFPHATCSKFKREHRTVVLPDYQGAGIGNAMSEFIAQHFTNQGFRYISTTSHPSMIGHRSRSHLWRVTRDLSHSPAFGKSSAMRKSENRSSGRLCASFEYIGKKEVPPQENS